MDKQEESGVLVKDKEYVKFVQLLKKAEEEGRLDGKYVCMLCGMRYQTKVEAEECCKVDMT
jgi:hypothetical protein